jgi:hypothetical protein
VPSTEYQGVGACEEGLGVRGHARKWQALERRGLRDRPRGGSAVFQCLLLNVGTLVPGRRTYKGVEGQAKT